MTYGGSIGLIIIGAILRYAITWNTKYVDIQAMGLIIMIGGAAGLIISLISLYLRRRREVAAEVTEQRRYVEPPS